MKILAAIAILALLAGCRTEQPKTIAPIVVVTYSDASIVMPVKAGEGPARFGGGVTVTHEIGGVVRICVGRFRMSEVDSAWSAGYKTGAVETRRRLLKLASMRSAAYADSVTGLK